MTDQDFKLNVLLVSYQKADVLTRSLFSLSREQQDKLLLSAKAQGIQDLLVISTCNRTELISSSPKETLAQLLVDHSDGTIQQLTSVQTIYQQNQAVYHLYKMGTGLDSQIVGDREIVGQLRSSFDASQKLGLVNSYTIRLITHVIHISKSIKNVTNLSSGTTSVAYAAVQYLKVKFQDMSKLKVLVVGLGKMGNHTSVNLLNNTNLSGLTITNRSDERAKSIARMHSSLTFAPFNQLKESITDHDVIIMSTSGNQDILQLEHFDEQKDQNKLILDLSLPSNVALDVIDLPFVDYINIDELSIITNETLKTRNEDVPKALEIIAKATQDFYQWLDFRKYAKAANSFKSTANSIKQSEIDFQIRKNPNYNSRDVEFVTERVINKLTAHIVDYLKNTKHDALETAELITKIFGK